MKTLVKTSLAIGGMKNFYFGNNGEHAITMYNNIPFERVYDNVEDFLKEFYPEKPSERIIEKINEQFDKKGEVVFKPKGYKSNQTFYFRAL